jgi:hypothetical protein
MVRTRWPLGMAVNGRNSQISLDLVTKQAASLEMLTQKPQRNVVERTLHLDECRID